MSLLHLARTSPTRARSKMDCVRAQQLENWQNQRNIAQENRASGAG